MERVARLDRRLKSIERRNRSLGNVDRHVEAGIERVLARAPRADHRHTLQHGQMIDAPLFRRMAALGLCANLFANHIWYWGDQHYEMTMGPDRAMRLDACGSALAAGVPLAIHSDAPVTPLGPLAARSTALARNHQLAHTPSLPRPSLTTAAAVAATREMPRPPLPTHPHLGGPARSS
jgi:predicted amidohydrolase YtcJ